MRFNKYFLYGGVAAAVIIGLIIYKNFDKSDTSAKYSDKVKHSFKRPETETNAKTTPQGLNEDADYYEICDMKSDEYEHLIDITDNNDVMASRLKESVEIVDFPTVLRKHEDSRYVKFAFKPKMDNACIYGFWRNASNDIEMSFKLSIVKQSSKKYLLKINKRIVHTLTSLKQIEIELKDNNQLRFIINDDINIPLHINNLQYFVIDANYAVKYKEDEKKLQ